MVSDADQLSKADYLYNVQYAARDMAVSPALQGIGSSLSLSHPVLLGEAFQP